MFRALGFVAVAVAVFGFVSGCSMPRTPIGGSLYNNVHANDSITDGDLPDSLKMGESTATSVIGITTGDCSIDAARQAGGIKKIHYVDYHSMHILGVYAKTTTKVYGE